MISLPPTARETAACGKVLTERLAIYPSYALDGERWLDPVLRVPVLRGTVQYDWRRIAKPLYG